MHIFTVRTMRLKSRPPRFARLRKKRYRVWRKELELRPGRTGPEQDTAQEPGRATKFGIK